MSLQRNLPRRRILAAAAVAASGLAMPRLVYAQNKKPIKFTLAWVAEGSTLYPFVAKGIGAWEKRGLDVDIARGSGSISAAQAIGEGRFDFGMSTPSIGLLQNIKGLPIVALACCAYDATMGVGVMNDGLIKTPKDLEGRTMASVVTSGDYPFLAPFAEKTGIDLTKINRLHVDNKVRNRLLPEGKVDAITGFASSAMPVYAATGVKAHFMLYSDYGIQNYGTPLMTQPARIANEPELCTAFVDGMLEGLKATLLDPTEAIKVFMKQVPEMALIANGAEQARVGNGINMYVAVRDQIKTNGLGFMELKDYDAMADMVMKYLAGEGDKRPDVGAAFTNKFVGGVKLTPSEWEAAQKNAQEFRPYVS